VPAVKRISRGHLKLRALELLIRFQLQFGKIERPPVPLDDLLRFLGLRLEFDDLSSRFGLEKKLGFTSVETCQIFIDESLDPSEHPELEGRLNFTIGHEIAHWILHRRILDPHLLSADDYLWLERQADWFASCLLMPDWLVLQEWTAKVGYDGPLKIPADMDEVGISNFGSRRAYLEALAEMYADDLAPLFKVSRESMRICLWQMRLLPRP
jgi:hypothetical protein